MLRRLAPRAIRVLARNSDREPGLASFDTSLGVNAPAYIEAYDTVRRYTKRRMEERTEAGVALDELLYKVRIWAPQVARDVEHVVASEFGENPDVPDDTISDAKVLIETVSKRADENKEPLPYTEELLEDLGNALVKAQAEWDEAEAAQADFRAMRIAVRETGVALEKDLVAFRRVLRTILGSEHPDYQKLRRERARTPDVDDDANAPQAPPTTTDEDELPPIPPVDTQPADTAAPTP
jgi:hypothetical protein